MGINMPRDLPFRQHAHSPVLPVVLWLHAVCEGYYKHYWGQAPQHFQVCVSESPWGSVMRHLPASPTSEQALRLRILFAAHDAATYCTGACSDDAESCSLVFSSTLLFQLHPFYVPDMWGVFYNVTQSWEIDCNNRNNLFKHHNSAIIWKNTHIHLSFMSLLLFVICYR